MSLIKMRGRAVVSRSPLPSCLEGRCKSANSHKLAEIFLNTRSRGHRCLHPGKRFRNLETISLTAAAQATHMRIENE